MPATPLIEPATLYPAGAGRAAYKLIDVRAPLEVAQGALPDSAALPILTDEERHQVGLKYKEAGQEDAKTLGFALTAADMPRRIAVWREAAGERPAAVMCWRGGLRSQLASDFIARPNVSRVAGGYKAVRNYVLAALEPTLARKNMLVLTGLTGSGKTDVLQALSQQTCAEQLQVLDLEAEANHRGSAFGANGVQPAQQTFENSLAVQLLLSPATRLVLEDESRSVGRRTLPNALFERMATCPVVMLEVPLRERTDNIFRDYVAAPSSVRGAAAVLADLLHNTEKLKGRLSSSHTEEIARDLRAAFSDGLWLEPTAHANWIKTVLIHYYDPLYNKGIKKLARPVTFTGDKEAVRSWFKTVATSV